MLSLVYKRLDADETLRRVFNQGPPTPEKIYQLLLDATDDEELAYKTKIELIQAQARNESNRTNASE